MMLSKNVFKYVVAFVFFVFVGCSPANEEFSQLETSESDVQSFNTIEFDSESVILDLEQMISEADIIFIGTVADVSPTHWNQDSGEYWEEKTQEGNGLETLHGAWPVHEVEFADVKPIVDTIGISEPVVLTEVSISPLSENREIELNDTTVLQGTASHDLKQGDEVVVFAVEMEIAWRDPNQKINLVEEEDNSHFDIGNRTVLGFVADPRIASYIKGEDGLYHQSHPDYHLKYESVTLDELLAMITKIRE